MAKKIVKVEDTEPKTKKKNNIDLSKIGKVISENSDTIEKLASVLLASNKKTTKTTKKKSSKKTTKKSNNNDSAGLSTAMDIFGSLLKK